MLIRSRHIGEYCQIKEKTMKVNILKNRGVVVNSPSEIGGIIVDLKECVDLEILDCRFARYKGLTGNQWAKKWLYESPRRPYKLLNAVPCATSQKESRMTKKSLRRSFMASTSRKLLKGEGHLIQEGLR
jgi:hypothetical protein